MTEPCSSLGRWRCSSSKDWPQTHPVELEPGGTTSEQVNSELRVEVAFIQIKSIKLVGKECDRTPVRQILPHGESDRAGECPSCNA
jgi:hypothetical protein